MKKKIMNSVVAILSMIGLIVGVVMSYFVSETKSDLFRQNVEVLSDAEGGVGVTTCLGLWGKCSVAGGESKAPLVHVDF